MTMLLPRIGYLLWLRGRDMPPPDDGHKARISKSDRPSPVKRKRALRASTYRQEWPAGIAL